MTAAITTTHSMKMVTPDAQPKSLKMWSNRDKWWPFKDAEDRVQSYLEVALNTAFPTCTIRAEQPTPEGRLDIEIIENDAIDNSKINRVPPAHLIGFLLQVGRPADIRRKVIDGSREEGFAETRKHSFMPE